MSKPEMLSMLVLSTQHVKPETWASLAQRDNDALPFAGGRVDFGYLVYAHDERPEFNGGMSDEIWAICEYANTIGADWIKFDCDAECVDELPVYEEG